MFSHYFFVTVDENVADKPDRTNTKRHRISYSKQQLSELEKQFKMDPYPTRTPLQNLSETLKLPIKHLIYWFQNRRMKEKKIREKNETTK